MRLLMITGLGSVKDLVSDKKGAFYNTLEEFHKYWDRIDIISPKIPNSKSDTKILFGNVYIHISPWPLILHPLWFLKKGIEIYREQKFDLMTVHDFPPFYNGIGARLLWQKIKVPYVLEIFHIPGHPRPASRKEFIYKGLMKKFIKYDAAKAEAVRIMNTDVGKFLEASGVPKEKIKLIPAIYVDLETYKPSALIPSKEYDLIFIGRLETNKGIDLLLKAVSNVKLQMPNVKCLIVGDGPQRKNYELRITNYGLGKNIKMFGWARDQKEIAELLNKSRILVMPSYNEGGPRVVVEAMACGVPVLATPVGIVPDLLKNLPAGRQAAYGGEIVQWDPKDIATKALGLLSDPEMYKKHSIAGPELAKSFEKKTAIKNYADKLKNIIQINK